MFSSKFAIFSGIGAISCVALLLVQTRNQTSQPPEPATTLAQSLPASQFEIPAPVETQAAVANEDAGETAAGNGATGVSGWDKKWWIEKASRVLRGGDAIAPSEDMGALAELPKDKIARHFMEDPRFGDTVLDFNLFFLGYKVDQLKSEGAYVLEAYDFANAVNSAKAVLENGDYLKLFDLEGDYYLPPLSETQTEHEKTPEDEKLGPDELRRKAAGELMEYVEGLIDLVDNPTPSPLAELCEEIEETAELQTEISQAFLRAFTDEEIFILDRAKLPDYLFEELQKILEKDCEAGAAGRHETDAIENRLWAINSKLDAAFQEIARFEPAVYGPDNIADFRPLNRAVLPVEKPWPVFGYRQSNALANSSTNYNRKRSAYTLKRFFCDDLTPVGFDMPQEHVSGTHGSQTSCFSCHYKLDPMAGFFRNYGAEFDDMSGEANIVFDDSAVMPRANYLKSWRSSESPEGTWAIGYIRSARWKDENAYGNSLADLSAIIRKAPEAKRCLMKRLTQYMLGENQTVDGGYLDRLTENFERDAAVNSTQALKNAMVSVLTSDTFQQRNPDPRTCYDLEPGTVTGDRPPCRIAYILEKNCVQCHNSSMTQNHLDLTIWNAGPPGETANFRHFDASGEAIKAKDTLRVIADRLSTSDQHKRMPKNITMSSQERQELYLWTQEEISQTVGTQ